MIHASSPISGGAAPQPREVPGPSVSPVSVMTPATAASENTNCARSSGSSASTGT